MTEVASIQFVPAEIHDLDAGRAVATLIDHVVDLPASDLFFAAEEDSIHVSVRHFGVVRHLTTLSVEQGRRMTSHVKALAGMDITERRHPSDGRWIYVRDDGRKVDLRLCSIPTLYGEDLSVRLLERDSNLRSLDGIGLERHEYNQLMNLLASPSGLILVTGPTGSGKTTTLYACIQYLNNGRRKINTIEDPVEYAVPGIRQSQVNARFNLDFPEMLRGVLRQAPDVIMIGEIRDSITAETAVRAANSGHLVFATLHAPVASGAVASMLALGVKPHFFASSLLGVLSQRLVRTLCPHCKVGFDLTDAPHTFEAVRPWLEPGQGDQMCSAKGCERCFQDGYAGRTAVFEMLSVTSATRRLIAEGLPAREIEQQAIQDGMIEFRRSSLLKVAQGVTSIEEVLRAVPTEYLGLD